ncbi:hypothetical protein [Geodermatophilus sp. DSM 44513]|uniref:hypothetical protein n=1 Tax=Geodermatophilus sp. DSM 44513 TaxID=1528104 RepID=UPI00141254BA|nr:hypothetical protein [Geodermatophilus sp. DSM 44513]WNV77551.1 hypothetical protein RTG05_09800 [Geodermatophilus sp. DSM 44513]
MPTSQVSPSWLRAWSVHALVVLGMTTLSVFALLTADGVPIGLGVLLLPLLLVGLPWSWPALTATVWLDQLPIALWWVALFGPAVLNVVLHGALLVAVATLRRRRGRPRQH